MMPWIVIAVVSSAAGLLMLGGDEPPAPPPPAPVADVGSLSDAIFWIGGCSVACSLIGAFALITVTKLKRKDRL